MWWRKRQIEKHNYYVDCMVMARDISLMLGVDKELVISAARDLSSTTPFSIRGCLENIRDLCIQLELHKEKQND